MWSLPDIERMNERKAAEALENANKTEEQLCEGEVCECCSEPATRAIEYYDVFSDDVAGHSFACEDHAERVEFDDESTFHCPECSRRMVTNYTWENYFTEVDGDHMCLNCALDKVTEADSEHWITEPEQITFDKVRHAPHVIGHKTTHWEKSLVFLGNACFDSMDGHCIGGGLDELTEHVKTGIKKHGKAILILDGGYQFSVSIGVYAPKKKTRKKKAA